MSYDGPALIGATPVRLRLAGRWEPIDGRYHWGGRVAPDPAIAQLVRAGRRDVRVTIADRSAPARLAEVDPWGGVRITGVGTPPWPAEEEDDDGAGSP
ncbi:protein of unknown function [Micromonospora pattaloongensis]|uniref:DUF4873 domain-containing protein n=1 Tax=Micromonospora pattaloongensis TaxID=405436 RepID=A0A1H3QTW1_9ACTN|nr:DUF4873 domain-containing protein [Micromonospora pattaloongensis]SDZ16770.1 protein of unknown function [Micromonospora pattaloongensis]